MEVDIEVLLLEDDDVEEEEVGALFGSYSRGSTSVGSVRKMVRSPEFEPPIDIIISLHHREVRKRYDTYTDLGDILGN